MRRRSKPETLFEKDNKEILDQIAGNVARIKYIDQNVKDHENGGDVRTFPPVIWDKLKNIRVNCRRENNKLVDQLLFKYRA